MSNNTDKLLRAFIEASGYEIKEVATAKSIADRKEYIALGCVFDPKLEYDYKVTKKVKSTSNKSTDEKLSDAVARLGR